jgi:hypothetical protein
MVTAIGALIVFATFVVKDGLREQLKDLTDAINGAQTSFIIVGLGHLHFDADQPSQLRL